MRRTLPFQGLWLAAFKSRLAFSDFLTLRLELSDEDRKENDYRP